MFLDDAGTQTSSLTGNEGIPRSLKTSDGRFGSFRSTWNDAYFPSWTRLFFSLTYQVGYNIPPIPHFEIMTNPDGVLQKTSLKYHFGENPMPISPFTYYSLHIKLFL